MCIVIIVKKQTNKKQRQKADREKVGGAPWTQRWSKKILRSCSSLKDSKTQTLEKKKPVEANP